MAPGLSELESRYLDCCTKQGVLPNCSILSSFLKANHQIFHQEPCNLEFFLDQLISSDLPPLIEALSITNLSEIDAVDVCQKWSNISLKGEYVLSLLHAVEQKLRIVNLVNWSFWEDILGDICHKGLMCRILNLRSNPIRKLNMVGNFMQLHTLNLDFSINLTSFQASCFSCMPKLMHLSMCATRVANLWITSAALSKLPSLVELRFQTCLCCIDTSPCSSTSEFKKTYSAQLQNMHYSSTKETLNSVFFDECLFRNHNLQDTTEESWDDNGMVTLSNMQGIDDWAEGQGDTEITMLPSDTSSVLTSFQLLEEAMYSSSRIEDVISEMSSLEDLNNSRLNFHESFSECCSLLKHIPCHPSPICFEKYYREYMIYTVPHLKVLDNFPIKNVEREKGQVVFKKYFEYLPYKRQYKKSVISILQKREMGSKQTYTRKSCHSFNRSLSAAKVGSSPWPQLHVVSNLKTHSTEDRKAFRPRQFEYHPCNPSLMVFGTLDGELVVTNHENQKLVGYLPSVGTLHSILGLCWLKKYPSKLIAGSDNGSLQLYDVCRMPSTIVDQYCSMDASMHTFDEFEHLTSVHINSSDEYFLASGFSNHVALYDIGSGKRLQILKDLHKEHINVVKFAHHSPSIFASASFDQDIKMWDLRQGTSQPCFATTSLKGNVMVCFSPDDHYLLASAIDNEVKQLLAVDGRLHMEFHIAPIGSAQNYTRSYYMNGRDYIITGSCEENVVRISCAQTGRRLRDLSLQSTDSGYNLFVQSLRGDPFRMFHMSILAAYLRPCTKSEIIKVNLLSSGDCVEEDSYSSHKHASSAFTHSLSILGLLVDPVSPTLLMVM